MNPVRTAAAVALVAVVGLVVILSGGTDDRYRLMLTLDNAAGLREGTGVKVAGLEAGEIKKLKVDDRDRVRVEVVIDDASAPVGRDVRLSVSPVNLLGQKVLDLDVGDIDKPAPSGFEVPKERVSTAADLDQVLAVLDPSTRARLAVLLNEAGLAVSDRRLDIQTLLRKYPRTSGQLAELLARLKSDNRTLGRLVSDGSSFVSTLAAQRRDLGELIDSTGEMSASLSGRRAQLRRTLSAAPGDLARLRAFLVDLQATAQPLGPAAQTLSRVSDPLRQTLKELKPFAKTSKRALDEATDAAPQLSRLAAGATPIVKELRPTAASLQGFSTAMAPASKVLDKSASNIIAVMDNWSHAIGLRDQLSHIFRAEAVVDPVAVQSLVERLLASQAKSGRPSAARRPTPAQKKTTSPRPVEAPPSRDDARTPPAKVPGVRLPPVLEKPLKQVTDVVQGLLGPKAQPQPAAPDNALLDFLLGK